MYVDLGKRRGRLHFTWKELCLLWALALSAAGYVVRSEKALATLTAQVHECQRELQQLRLPVGVRGSQAGRHDSAATNQRSPKEDE